MAVGLEAVQSLTAVSGIQLASSAAGIRYTGRDDLVLMALAPGTQTAAVFTRNRFCAAPVTLCRRHLEVMAPRYLLINSGNANAGTGAAGMQDAVDCCAAVAALADVDERAVLPFSTGVIGERLPVKRLVSALPELMSQLDAQGWVPAARAIMTTDTLPKGISRQVVLSTGTVTMTGIVKGAGMIRPDMATMLAFIATDAEIDAERLQLCLEGANQLSFNAVTVDGDTSTNDACVLCATGRSGVLISRQEDVDRFEAALLGVMQWLAQALIRDGEGATKFVTLEITGAQSIADARAVGYTVAHSPLVKTALFASDPNWGRILAAVGRAPIESLDLARVDLFLDEVPVILSGEPALGYTEAQGQAVMDRDEITIRIDLGQGDGVATLWTTDLSHEYVSINADYRS